MSYCQAQGTLTLNEELTQEAYDAIKAIQTNRIEWWAYTDVGEIEIQFDEVDAKEFTEKDFDLLLEAIEPLGYKINGRLDYWGDWEGCFLVKDNSVTDIDKEYMALYFESDEVLKGHMEQRGFICIPKDAALDIKVVVNNGGVVQSVYVPAELKNADVEVIDFCTDDPDRYEEADEAWQEVEAAEMEQKLVAVY